MKKIWVVEGACGEYAENRQWPVRAFLSEQRAQSLVLEAQAESDRIYQEKENDGDGWYNHYFGKKRAEKFINTVDPNFETDYTKTRYYCYSVGLDERE